MIFSYDLCEWGTVWLLCRFNVNERLYNIASVGYLLRTVAFALSTPTLKSTVHAWQSRGVFQGENWPGGRWNSEKTKTNKRRGKRLEKGSIDRNLAQYVYRFPSGVIETILNRRNKNNSRKDATCDK